MINSPLYREPINEYDDVLPPIGLGYICTDLKNNGINIKLLDAVSGKISLKDIIKYIVDGNFTHIGLNVFSTNNELVKEIIESVPKKVEFILGGALTKTNYNEILKWKPQGNITVVVGEADSIVSDIVLGKVTQSPYIQELENKVYIVDKNSEYFPNDISKLEIDRTLFEYEPNINAQSGKKEGNIITSRGCIYDCAFCSAAVSLNKGTKARIKNKKSIIKEIQGIINLHPEIQSIRILDDLFLRNKKSIKMATDIFNQFNITWRAMAHIKSFTQIDNELLSKIKDSGCTELSIGIESGNIDILKSINKINTPKEIKETIEKILKAGIGVKGYFIYGFPGETEKQFEDTYNIAKYLKKLSLESNISFRISVFQFRPYHGTKLYNNLVKSGKNITNIKSCQNFGKKGIGEYDFGNGNFSGTEYNILKDYIIKTRKLNEL